MLLPWYEACVGENLLNHVSDKGQLQYLYNQLYAHLLAYESLSVSIQEVRTIEEMLVTVTVGVSCILQLG